MEANAESKVEENAWSDAVNFIKWFKNCLSKSVPNLPSWVANEELRQQWLIAEAERKRSLDQALNEVMDKPVGQKNVLNIKTKKRWQIARDFSFPEQDKVSRGLFCEHEGLRREIIEWENDFAASSTYRDIYDLL